MRESTIEKYLTRKVHELGGKSVKMCYTGIAGMPDRLLLFDRGLAVFVEVKAPDGRVSPIQTKRMEQLEQLGFDVHVVDSTAEVDTLIERQVMSR